MSTITREADVQEDLFSYIEQNFDLQIHSSTRIDRGWLNLKWRLATSRGVMFAKEYHPKRYQIATGTRVAEVKTGLNWHAHFYESGIPCPRLYAQNGEYLLCTEAGRYLVLMDFCEGEIVPAGQVNRAQIHDLGQVTGQMHRLFQERIEVDKPVATWQPSLTRLTETWATIAQQAAEEQVDEWIVQAIEEQRAVLDRLDLSMVADCEPGWTHSDLWVDNLLFAPERTTAILDFDRVRYLYPEVDVARAILSCALRDGEMDVDAVVAYIEGYRKHRHFAVGRVSRALKLIWCLESTWWITPNMGQRGEAAVRFADEMRWLAEHWDHLDDLFQGV